MSKEKSFGHGDLFQRVVVHSLVLAFLVLLLYTSLSYVGSWTVGLVLSLLGALGTYEYCLMLKKKVKFKPTYHPILGTFGVLFLSFLVIRWQDILPAYCQKLPSIYVFLWTVWVLFSFCSSKKSPLITAGTSIFSVLYLSVPLYLFLKVLYGFLSSSQPYLGVWWTSFLIATTKGADIFGYFFGKAFGKRQISPNLSPNKTVAGFIAGCLGSMFIAALFCFQIPPKFIPFIAHPSFLLPLGLILGICGFFGDILESGFKRDADIKDSNKIPSVGGILDNLDSLLLSTPVLYFCLSLTQSGVFGV
ncbi:phosphatidate cytidylyltransferase [Chlamydiifrater phoenicopteri]|uniref:phosphatidate cytidylyltransferase n=1 Tax=Chlamydiifrater phoenicopteri TaxID=2681469 RepID=UPI001BCD2AEC|nr:phosphatidate cytidylyltransferase [Chlamydiifrater phoenicopteri]